MKKGFKAVLSIALAAAMMFGMTACGGNSGGDAEPAAERNDFFRPELRGWEDCEGKKGNIFPLHFLPNFTQPVQCLVQRVVLFCKMQTDVAIFRLFEET